MQFDKTNYLKIYWLNVVRLLGALHLLTACAGLRAALKAAKNTVVKLRWS